MEFISEVFFLKISKNEDYGFEIFEKGQILRRFSGLAPSKLKIEKNWERGKVEEKRGNVANIILILKFWFGEVVSKILAPVCQYLHKLLYSTVYK